MITRGQPTGQTRAGSTGSVQQQAPKPPSLLPQKPVAIPTKPPAPPDSGWTTTPYVPTPSPYGTVIGQPTKPPQPPTTKPPQASPFMQNPWYSLPAGGLQNSPYYGAGTVGGMGGPGGPGWTGYRPIIPLNSLSSFNSTGLSDHSPVDEIPLLGSILSRLFR